MKKIRANRTKNKLTRAARGEHTRSIILEAATELFLEHGYQSASINLLIKQTGGSKETIYRYFGNKEGLFLTVIDEVMNEILEPLDNIKIDHLGLRGGLEHIGINVLSTLLSEKYRAFNRLIKNVSQKHHNLGQYYYHQISTRSYKIMADFFGTYINTGKIKKLPPRRMAQYYWAMLLFDLEMELDFYIINSINKKQLTTHVKRTVSDFLIAFGTK